MSRKCCNEAHRYEIRSISAAPAGMRAVWAYESAPYASFEPVLGLYVHRDVCEKTGPSDDQIGVILLDGRFICPTSNEDAIHNMIGYSIPGDGLNTELWESRAKEFIEKEKGKK